MFSLCFLSVYILLADAEIVLHVENCARITARRKLRAHHCASKIARACCASKIVRACCASKNVRACCASKNVRACCASKIVRA